MALFAALSYAVTQSGRGSGSIAREQATLDNAVAQQCIASVEQATMRLQVAGGCSLTEISYELPDGTNENPANPDDKSCFVFDPEGAGATPCGAWLTANCSAAAMLVLNPGEKCDGADIVYVGTNGGRRIYTTTADRGSIAYGAAGFFWGHPPADSTSDGLANTDVLVAETGFAAPYAAALACRSLGQDWYLPAQEELLLLYNARSTGVLNGTFDETGDWWTFCSTYISSTYDSDNWVQGVHFCTPASGMEDIFNVDTPKNVRCVRRD